MTAGGRRRARNAVIALIIFAAFMHVFAYWTVAAYANANLTSDTATLVGLTGTLVLSWSLLLSQAMELVTRAFYSRSDLDLILTSPASARKVFAVRMGRIATAAVAIAVLLAAPFINVLAFLGGSRWLGAYGVVAAMGAVATAAALALTIALFRVVGAKRTRLIAQIVAAVIGAAFVIGLQIVAIFSAGSLSRFTALQSDWTLRHAPVAGSAFWWPARAVLGDYAALAAVIAFGMLFLVGSIALFSRRFGEHAVAAAGVSSTTVRQRRWSLHFRRRSAGRVLRQKEWTLLQRDPWLISQTLMQILLSHSAGVAAVDHFRQRQRRLRRADSGGGDGGRPACRRSRVAVDFRRGRARSRRDRSDRRATHYVGQDRSRHRHDRADFRADRRS